MQAEYKYKASCPICGRNLFRGSPESVIEGNCPKCGSALVIRYSNTGVAVTVSVFRGQTGGDDKSEYAEEIS